MKKILVLDDNLDILDIVTQVLNYESFDVITISESVNFIEVASNELPDLVLLDYRLGDGNGGELCKQIKSNPKLSHIPVILFTACVLKRVEIKEIGCDAVINKPFDLEDFVEKINDLLTPQVS